MAGTRPTVRLRHEAKAVTKWVTLYGFSPEPLNVVVLVDEQWQSVCPIDLAPIPSPDTISREQSWLEALPSYLSN